VRFRERGRHFLFSNGFFNRFFLNGFAALSLSLKTLQTL
jgi:hypothetical protein